MASLKSKVRQVLREVDRNESIRRRVRTVRNLLREPPPRNSELVLEPLSFEYPTAYITFRAGNRRFTSTLDVGCLSREKVESLDDVVLNRCLIASALSIAPYHFLQSDFKRVRVPDAQLPPVAVRFYEEYFLHGLAEFRYRQGLNPGRPIKVVPGEEKDFDYIPDLKVQERVLMLNGGGKDTAVMCELLKLSELPLEWLSVSPRESHRNIRRASGISQSMEVDFEIDPKVFDRPTYPWGHMPTSGMLLSTALLPAIASGCRYVTTGNECSANEGNVQWRGRSINHQYTKSHDFESAFNRMVEACIGKGLRAFSALRMFHDVQIAQMLVRFDQYLGEFVSCNRGSGWCNDCEKCAFVYLAMSAFFPEDVLVRIFGENLWMKARTRALILHLMKGRVKRWECVGTQDECKLAAILHFRRYGERDFLSWPSMDDVRRCFVGADAEALTRRILLGINSEHNIPDSISSKMEDWYRHLVVDRNIGG